MSHFQTPAGPHTTDTSDGFPGKVNCSGPLAAADIITEPNKFPNPASTIHGLAMDNLLSLHLENEIATGLRAAS